MSSWRFRVLGSLVLVLLGGGILALAWWDWAYPSQIIAWWRDQRIYAFFWHQLGWALAVSECACLILWLTSAYVHTHNLWRAAQPFLLAPLAALSFLRYSYHPLGVQLGSSIWTYWLLAVTVSVTALPLSRLLLAAGRVLVPRERGWRIVWAAVILYALIWGFLSVARHDGFRSHALDLGTMDQAAWNTIHGRILERSPLYRPPSEGSRYENRLLDAKMELLFIPLSALYWLWADPRVLLIVQTLFLASGAIPLYGLVQQAVFQGQPATRTDGRASWIPALIATGYLLYLPLHYVQMSDFHTSALMVPFLIGAWWAMRRRRWRAYYVWLLLALCCRIDAAFAALGISLAIAIGPRQGRRHALYTLGLAAAWLAVDLAILMPIVRGAYGPGAGDLVARRFEDLGGDIDSALLMLIQQPVSVLRMLADREKLQTVFDLLIPLGFTPLIGLPAFLPAFPVLVINLLANSTWQNSIHAHYMAPVIPFLWIAAGEGLAWLVRRGHPDWSTSLATVVWANTLAVSIVFSPFPPGKAFHLANYYQPSSHLDDLRATTLSIPPDASVCAQSDIYPHVSQRRDAVLFPYCALDNQEEAEYVILDLDASSTKSPLGFHAFYQLVDAWLARPDYGVTSQRGGVLVLQRGASRANMDAVLQALDQYGREFYRVDYEQVQLPAKLEAKSLYRISITLRNQGTQCWTPEGQLPVRLSYRWWTAGGALLAIDPLRTDLPYRVESGRTVRLHAWLRTPPEPGQYKLEWDMLREGDAWFGDMGGTMLRYTITVD
jgi:uncharacterized membrane protein